MIIPMGKSFMVIPDPKVNLENSSSDVPNWLICTVFGILIVGIIIDLTRD